MTFDPSAIVNTSIGAIVGVIAGAILQSFRKDALKAEVKTLREEKVEVLEKKLDHHIENDDSKTAKSERSQILRKLDTIGSKVDLTREDVAALKAQREADLTYLGNVNTALQQHKRDGH